MDTWEQYSYSLYRQKRKNVSFLQDILEPFKTIMKTINTILDLLEQPERVY